MNELANVGFHSPPSYKVKIHTHAHTRTRTRTHTQSFASLPGSMLHDTKASLEDALQLNLMLQRKMMTTIQKVCEFKKKIATSLLQLENEQAARNVKINKRKRDESTYHPIKFAKNWDFNNSRKWTRRYFLDPYNLHPEPNKDTLKRRQWEGDLRGKMSFRYTPWSEEEMDLLKSCVQDVRKRQQQRAGSVVEEKHVDFHKVTELITQRFHMTKMHQKIKSYSYVNTNSEDGTCQLRSWSDYRNKYLYCVTQKINMLPFTEKEITTIRDYINVYKDSSHIPWDIVALRLNNSRTPFQCFKLFHQKMKSHVGIFSGVEDELLLKYVAASGPQLVLNHHTKAPQHFFPHLSSKHILTRINTSLVNPSYRNERWNANEERMLVTGMKVFCDCENATSKVAVLLPDRSSKLVMDKWNRCLNPIYSTQPFTQAERKKLLSFVKKSHGLESGDWKAIAKKFPSRNPRSLFSLYRELVANHNYT